jgi:uncharacterized protein YjbI with pentapeptide repeats
LRNADLRNARLCFRDNHRDDFGDRIGCIDLRGADVHGADLRGALICENGREPRSCQPVDAQTLRQYTKSTLDGALL